MSTSLLLDLRQMRGAHDRIERVYEASAFAARDEDEDYAVADRVRLAFDVHKSGHQFRLVGTVATTLEVTCGRCLEPFKFPVSADFDLIYLPHTENTGEGEVPVEDEDLATAFYRDETIDLGQLIREQFYLALPMKPLCQEACRGLCPQCGTNLNTGTCACVPRWTDPRLAALKALTEKDRS